MNPFFFLKLTKKIPMKDLLDYTAIKRKIERELCTEHNAHPELKKTAKGFQIDSCCEEFNEKLTKKVGKIVAEQTKLGIEKMLKNAFKK